MTGHRSFSELVVKMPRKAQEEIKRGTAKILAEMELAELREALEIRQIDLAQKLKTTQAAVSRLERRGNVTIGKLKDYIEALGGRLELNAVLPGHTVKITHAFKENAHRIGTIATHSKGKSASTIHRKRKTSQAHVTRRVYA
jgi:transcriptional regulator with XRE-family HTH domain